MALSTLDELRASLGGWLHRKDVTSTASGVGVDRIVNDWIALAEAELNSELRLRTMESDRVLTTVPGSRYVDLPADFIEPVSLLLQLNPATDPYPLDFWPVQNIGQRVNATIPVYWTIDGDKIRFDCPASDSYTLIFRQIGKFQLSDAAPTNWLLTNYPNVYLFGALMQSPGYVGVEERSAVWPERYSTALSKLMKREARAKTLTTLSADPALLSPRRSGFNIYRGD